MRRLKMLFTVGKKQKTRTTTTMTKKKEDEDKHKIDATNEEKDGAKYK